MIIARLVDKSKSEVLYRGVGGNRKSIKNKKGIGPERNIWRTDSLDLQ